MATERECLINQKIMGGCNHPDFVLKSERVRGMTVELIVCTSCNAQQSFFHGQGTDNAALLKRLKALIPNYCSDMTMIRIVLRQIEKMGWRWSMLRSDGVYVYAIAKNEQKVVGQPNKIELEAICSAVTKLAGFLP